MELTAPFGKVNKVWFRSGASTTLGLEPTTRRTSSRKKNRTEKEEDKETSEENERRPVNRDSLELKVDGTNETER